MISELFKDFAFPNTPGASVLVVREGQNVCCDSFGLADLEQGLPCTPETNFRLASLTKQFTAMAVLFLMERGKLALNEPLKDFFPECPTWGETITVRHLLSHTSGLLDYEDLIPAATTLPLRDADVLRLLLDRNETYFPPGTKYRYSNSGYALLALIVEIRSGYRFAAFVQENIFRTLKMQNTVAYERGISFVPQRAFGYAKDGDHFRRDDQSLTSSVLGDGGIYSSITDLARWDQALYSEALVNAPTRGIAFTGITSTDLPDTDYGCGWFISGYRGLKELWHYGETVGFTTHISRFPERRFTSIILTNRSEANIGALPHRLADMFLF